MTWRNFQWCIEVSRSRIYVCSNVWQISMMHLDAIKKSVWLSATRMTTHCGIVLQSWSDSITDVTVRAQENSLHGGAKNRYLYSTFTYAELLHDLFLYGWRVWAPRNTVRGGNLHSNDFLFLWCFALRSQSNNRFIKGSHNKLQRRPLLLIKPEFEFIQSLSLHLLLLSNTHLKHNTTTMNSFELACQMRRISLAESSNCHLPPPPMSLDSSGFDQFNSMSSFNSFGSQFSQGTEASSPNAMSSDKKSLSRSRCIANLSAMGSVNSEGSSMSRSSVSKYELPVTNAGWGYFVDSVESRWAIWRTTIPNFTVPQVIYYKRQP